MKKTHYLLLATCFTASFTTGVFADDNTSGVTPSKANTLESPEFIDVMPSALKGVDLTDAETVIKTAFNAFATCKVDVSAYLTYMPPSMHNPQEVREKTIASMQNGCSRVQELLGDTSDIEIKVVNIDYNDDKTTAQVNYDVNYKENTMKNNGKLIKTTNGWRIK